MHILGISAFYHDSAACLLRDGEVIAAAQQERFSRQKHDEAFPADAVRYCLEEARLCANDLDYIGFYEKPLKKFERLLETYLAFAPAGIRSFRTALPRWLGQKLHLPREIHRELGLGRRRRIVFSEHHESHASSAFFPSPFDEAAILTMDGVGEWATATWGHGSGNRIELSQEIRFPHSLGLLYSAFTYYTGFKVNEGEYKMMGLAPYGQPEYADKILDNLIDVKPDGSFWMDMSYFNYCQGLTMTSERFDALFGSPPRKPDEPVTQFHMDLAASIQRVTEEIMLRAARHVHMETGSRNLCLAGGVALNCVANGRILREGPFENVWIQPAAGDAGGALGVAMLIWYQLLDNPRESSSTDRQQGSLLGSRYRTKEICTYLQELGVPYERLDEQTVIERVVELLDEGKIVGWMQNRMEFGPRALGSRSILGDSRRPETQTNINLKVKFRESFRPFAPSVLRDHVHEYFATRPGEDSPYMLIVAPVVEKHRRALSERERSLTGIDLLKVPRSDVPAVTHVDYSARVQTVDSERHGRYHRLLERFLQVTGCPVIVNTSFNLGWEPIVNTPEDALRTFMSCDLDAVVLEDVLILKDRQIAAVEAQQGSESGAHVDEGLEAAWSCAACAGELQREGDGGRCSECGWSIRREEGIWRMFWSDEVPAGDVTDTVKAFYEEHPFPNYNDFDSLQSLISKSREGIYAKLLTDQIPFNARVLEVGCGTGQLSNFLAVGCRTVVGTDLCLNSLRLAEQFRVQHGTPRVRFAQMNLFHPGLRDAHFDVVLCNGVLHHTSDPYAGFRRIARLVKPGGHIIIGLYNRFGRWITDARRQIFRFTDGRFAWLDPMLRREHISDAKRESWFADQYRHPHESKHTVREVLGWFDENGLEFVNAIPKIGTDEAFSSREQLFEPADRGTLLSHAATQAKMVFSGYREGGFYVMIGRRVGG